MPSINFEFFSIDPVTIVGVLCNFLILLILFKKFLFGPVNKIIDERKAQVTKTYDEADEALTKAKSMEAEYTEKLAAAKEESAEIVKAASKKAQARSDEMIEAAKNEANAIVTKANADIERERRRAVNQIKDEISDIAFSVAGEIIGREVSSDGEQDRLIDEFIDKIGSDEN